MSLPFLRPSPPPSAQYMRSFLRSGTITRQSGLHLRRQAIQPASYSTATSPPSSAVPTGSGPAADTKGSHAASAAPSSTASISSPPPIPPKAADTVSPGQPLESLPFYIRRTASDGLPVYHDTKAGGTLRQTIVRKVEGDRNALKARLVKDLPDLLKPEHVRINQLTGNIVIKGHVAREVSGVLRGLHF